MSSYQTHARARAHKGPPTRCCPITIGHVSKTQQNHGKEHASESDSADCPPKRWGMTPGRDGALELQRAPYHARLDGFDRVVGRRLVRDAAVEVAVGDVRADDAGEAGRDEVRLQAQHSESTHWSTTRP